MGHPSNPLVSTQWLDRRRGQPDLKIVDAPFYLPGDPRTAHGEYKKAHIPGAVLFDLDRIADRTTDLPHMLPPPQAFAEAVGALGIGDADRVVVYDHLGLMSAARVWWNFRVMGHEEVYVLDGGLPRWLAEERAVVAGPAAKTEPSTFTPHFRPRLVRDISEVTQALARGGQVLDARPAGRFCGAEPEPRPGLPSGHMRGALNLPYGGLIADGALLPPDQLQARFKATGANPDRPVIATCGSGVTAAVIALALARLGFWDTPIYDGSWAEWAGRPQAEIAVG